MPAGLRLVEYHQGCDDSWYPSEKRENEHDKYGAAAFVKYGQRRKNNRENHSEN